jgi:hypothetical protein
MFPNKTLPAWPESKSSHQPESPTANEAGDARYLSTGRAVPITYGLVPSANPAMLSTHPALSARPHRSRWPGHFLMSLDR